MKIIFLWVNPSFSWFSKIRLSDILWFWKSMKTRDSVKYGDFIFSPHVFFRKKCSIKKKENLQYGRVFQKSYFCLKNTSSFQLCVEIFFLMFFSKSQRNILTRVILINRSMHTNLLRNWKPSLFYLFWLIWRIWTFFFKNLKRSIVRITVVFRL